MYLRALNLINRTLLQLQQRCVCRAAKAANVATAPKKVTPKKDGPRSSDALAPARPSGATSAPKTAPPPNIPDVEAQEAIPAGEAEMAVEADVATAQIVRDIVFVASEVSLHVIVYAATQQYYCDVFVT
jgi:hypothetical protein